MNSNWSGATNYVQESESKTGSIAHPTTEDGMTPNEQGFPFLASSIDHVQRREKIERCCESDFTRNERRDQSERRKNQTNLRRHQGL